MSATHPDGSIRIPEIQSTLVSALPPKITAGLVFVASGILEAMTGGAPCGERVLGC
jgi:hypothetical protein